MSKKILNLHLDILLLSGIYFAIRFIYTKEMYIQLINGYKINTLFLLIHTIIIVGIYRRIGENNNAITKQHKKQER